MKARDCLLGCLILLPHVLVVALHVSFLPKIRHRSAPSAALLGSQQQQQQHASRCGHLKATVQESPGEEAVAYGTDAAPEDAAQWPYDWRKHWYAVGYDRDIVEGPKPFAVSIFDEPLMLYRDTSGALQCVGDYCPHRASKLSEGQITEEGNIECLYHGWQFEGSKGACLKVPQLPDGATPPRAATLRVYPLAVNEGVVYVWMGENPWGEGAKEILPIPSTPDHLDENKPTFTYEFVCDLPYDWSYLTENLLDPAHIPVSHDKTEGGGKKENACPTQFDIIKEGPDAPSSTGFSSIVKSKGFGSKEMLSTRYRMHAPGVIRVRSEGKKEGEPIFGAALHCIPLGKGRSRLLFKTYAMNFPPMVGFIYGLKPKFLRHLNSCKILEQDLNLICAQEDHVSRTGKTLSESFLPIKSSDVLVVELRKWLDRVGHGMPFFEGWKKSKEAADLNDHEDCRRPSHRAFESRYHRHVLICAETRRALATVKRVKKGGLAVSALLAAASVLLSRAGAVRAAAAAAPPGVGGLVAALGSLCSLGLAAAANALEARFYTNFERHASLG